MILILDMNLVRSYLCSASLYLHSESYEVNKTLCQNGMMQCLDSEKLLAVKPTPGFGPQSFISNV